MSGELTLSVFEIVGSRLAVASDDGQRIFERISSAIKEGKVVSVSFRNVQSITSAFLNAAIGQLYGFFREDEIRSQLKVVDMQADDLLLLKRVVDTAKKYFKDPDKFSRVVSHTLGDKPDAH